MKKRQTWALLLSALLAFSCVVPVYATEDPDSVKDDTLLISPNPMTSDYQPAFTNAAEILSSLGILRGTGDGLSLEKVPSRLESAVMTVRMLGKESEALSVSGPYNQSSVYRCS